MPISYVKESNHSFAGVPTKRHRPRPAVGAQEGVVSRTTALTNTAVICVYANLMPHINFAYSHLPFSPRTSCRYKTRIPNLQETEDRGPKPSCHV